ncbi:NUDIX domain-containing protein [Paenibacillus azoreducens]|uniref:DNA mismatch repair protein MutT n=1 Tax=Paenibacillus azoreducens TaxID=116718 RepID=A0A920CQB2_9BACL|nr:NUDIX domain-containing protein [Paenibacillus azoreducens]GIO45268.1 DNA mismatch repair protein MutT [Paenibacillus azoreducens]
MYIEELRNRSGNLPLIIVRPTLILLNDEGSILMVKHHDNTWGLPGGMLEPGESVEDALKRELREELDIKINVNDLNHFQVFSDSRFYISQLGADTHYIAITYYTKQFKGKIKPDQVEVTDFGFFKPDEMPDQTMNMIKVIVKQFETSNHYKGVI